MIRMLRKAFYPIALLGLSLFVSRAAADDAALINALVHKGVLNLGALVDFRQIGIDAVDPSFETRWPFGPANYH
jgi:hypothetical protein